MTMTATPTAILEFASLSAGALRVDTQAGIIRGVKVLGLESKNGRTYTPEAIRGAVGLYEGVKVNINHPSGRPNQPRAYESRIGELRNVRAEPTGLFADLHYNPKHPLAEQLIWDAEHSPSNCGLSHNVEGRTVTRNGKTVVEEILRVHSVDLVADPASTRGLFESGGGQRASGYAHFLESMTGKRPGLGGALGTAAFVAELRGE